MNHLMMNSIASSLIALVSLIAYAVILFFGIADGSVLNDIGCYSFLAVFLVYFSIAIISYERGAYHENHRR